MLTEQDKELVKGLVDSGEPLPTRYRHSLFADASAAELVWPGKTSQVESAVLPFQSIEHVDEPRQEAGELDLFGVDSESGRQSGGWTNKLIWGDNRLILSSLANGPMRDQIERAGGLKLVYIDPPFDVGADFEVDIEVGDDEVTKAPSVVEEVAYRDTWGRGRDSFIAMMYERLRLISDLLAPDGAIWVHCDWRVNALLRLVMDEIFQPENFRNEVVWWYYNKYQGNVKHFPRNHDTLLYYTKSTDDFTFEPYFEERDEPVKQLKRVWDSDRGKLVNAKGPDGKVMYQERTQRRSDSVWRIPMLQPADRTENRGYPTQKREEIAERIISSCTEPGDLVADFFCGSGTALAVAEKLGRKWIGADLGRFAVHTSRKRLIDVQRERKKAGEDYRAFEILNLGKYERQYFTGVDMTLPEEERQKASKEREDAYLNLIMHAYSAERSTGLPPFHGTKGRTAVVVGPLDAPVTESVVREAIEAATEAGISRVDVLGFEFEMGLKPLLQDEAKDRGVNLALRHIPNDVFDKRAVDKGGVAFHDVAYVEVRPDVSGRTLQLTLEDFGVFYRQEDADAAAASLRKRSSQVVIDNGQVVKISKDTKGVVSKEVLTKHWSDWIDYWAIDFDYESQPEVVRVMNGDHEEQRRTGRFVFENEWQSYRTRSDRKLELRSGHHEYDESGTYKVALKVIDIFGNDTTKVVRVTVGG